MKIFFRSIESLLFSLLLCLAVGCSETGGGGSDSGGNDVPSIVEGSYTMKYNSTIIDTFTAIGEFHLKYGGILQETADYTINAASKTITLTKSGYDKIAGGDDPIEDSYTLKYLGTTIETFTGIENFYLKYGETLQETADYSINAASKTITLTKSGYDKIAGGDDPIEDSYTMNYYGETIETFATIDEFHLKYGRTLQETVDYNIDTALKIITLTQSGYDKITGGDAPIEGSYTMNYYGETIETFTAIGEFYLKYGGILQETADYSINAASKTITLTQSGYDKITGGNDPVEGSYTLKYDGETIETFTAIDDFYSKYSETLQETVDYTIDTASKTITLTKNGYDKITGGNDFISKEDMIYDEETGWYTNPAQTLRYNKKMEIETDWNKDGVWETLLGTPMSFSVNNKFEFDNFEAGADVNPSKNDGDEFSVTAEPRIEGDNKISICFTIKNISKYKWTGANFAITTAFNKSSISSTDTGRRVSVANKSKYTVDYFSDNLVFGGGNSSSIIGSVSKYDYYLKLNLEDVRSNNTVTCKVTYEIKNLTGNFEAVIY